MAKEPIEEPEPIPTVEATGDPEAEEFILRANVAAERLEKANQELKGLLLKKQVLQAEETLGGTADAGTPAKIEETPKEYAARVMHGETPKK